MFARCGATVAKGCLHDRTGACGLICLNTVARGSSATPRLGLVVEVVIPAGPSLAEGKLRPCAPLQKGHNFNARHRSCVWFSHLSTREKNVASSVLRVGSYVDGRRH